MRCRNEARLIPSTLDDHDWRDCILLRLKIFALGLKFLYPAKVHLNATCKTADWLLSILEGISVDKRDFGIKAIVTD